MQFTRPVELLDVLKTYKFSTSMFISAPDGETVSTENVSQYAKSLATELHTFQDLIELNVEVSFNPALEAHSTVLGAQGDVQRYLGAIQKTPQLLQQRYNPPEASRIPVDQHAVTEDPSVVDLDEQGPTLSGRVANHNQLSKCMENYSMDIFN